MGSFGTGQSRAAARRIAAVAAWLAAGVAAAGAQPMQLPGAQPLNPAGVQQAAPPGSAGPAKPRAPAMPAIKVPGEDSVLGKTLRRHGGHGEAVLEKSGTGYGLRLKADGFQTTNPTEPCAISFGEAPIPVTPIGRPAGLARYRLEASICPIVFDVLDGALLVSEPVEPCQIAAAACRIEVKGLWGPDAAGLQSRAQEIEKQRGAAERAMREGYRILTAKSDAITQRSIAREQAGFSAERELICRDFQREGRLGYCAAKVTEARAAAIRARLGITSEPKADKPKPRRPAPPKPQAPAPAPTQ